MKILLLQPAASAKRVEQPRARAQRGHHGVAAVIRGQQPGVDARRHEEPGDMGTHCYQPRDTVYRHEQLAAQ